MSTYLDHGGAAREQALARLWCDIEARVARSEQVRVEHFHPPCELDGCGWGDDTSTLVVAFSGHAYGRVMRAVEQVVAQGATEIEELRSAYTLLEVSRELAMQFEPRRRYAP